MTANFALKDKFNKQHLTQNIGLKITSLIVAVVLWLVVVNVTDPVITETYKNVPVKILNENVITDAGKTLEVLDGTDVVTTVTIKASRNTIQELGSTIDNIVATADMKNLSMDGTSVPIEISTTKYFDKIDTIRSSSNMMYVNIENRKTIQLPLKATTSGDIESGFILGNVNPNQNQVKVSGPESVIERVASAAVDVQVTGFTSNISTQSDIVLYDENGEAVETDLLELNVESVRVDVEILATKKVPIYYSTSGMPSDGYQMTGEIDCNPNMVVVAGSEKAIADVTHINIPATELNITGQSSNMMVLVNLADYLPDGVRLGDASFNGKATLTVYIEPLVEDDFEVALSNVEIENTPEGFDAEIVNNDEKADFTLIGLAQNLEKIDLSKLNYRVDFDDYSLLNDTVTYKEGTYTLYLVMDLPDSVECKDTVGIRIKLKKHED